MPTAALLILMMVSPFGDQRHLLTKLIGVVLREDVYEVNMMLEESYGGKYPSHKSVFSTVCLSPLQRQNWPGLEEGVVRNRKDKLYEIRRTVSFGIRRLPFGLFLATIRIEGTIKEPGKRSTNPISRTATRFIPLGRDVRVDLGRDKGTGDRLTWEVSVKGGVPQKGQ